MKLTFEEITKSGNYSQTIEFDFSDENVEDVLLKKVNNARVEIEAYTVSDDEIYVGFEVEYNIEYLDAYDLSKLNLTFDFEDNAIFTTNLEKAQELDLEYVVETEIDLYNLILDLIIVDVPLNYTRSKNSVKTDGEIESSNMQSPFANIFKKEE